MIRLGVMSSCSDKIEEKFANIRNMGFDNCQMTCWNSAFLNDEYAERVNNACKEYGIEITGLWCGWDGGNSIWNFYEGPMTLGLVPREYRADRVKMYLKASAFAEKIGVTDIITHCGFLPENPLTTEYHEVVTVIRHIASQYKKRGQWFLFETGQETPVTLRRTIEDVGTGNLGINLDPANLIMYGKGNPIDALGVFGEFVRNLHGKDGNYPTTGKFLGKEMALGQGSVDYPRFIAKLKAIGYDGPITIEREIKGEKQIEDILMAKKYLTELINA